MWTEISKDNGSWSNIGDGKLKIVINEKVLILQLLNCGLILKVVEPPEMAGKEMISKIADNY